MITPTDNQMIQYAMKRFTDTQLFKCHSILRIEYTIHNEPYMRFAQGIINPRFFR